MRSLDLLNTKKIAWMENGDRWVQLNIPKIIMGGLIGCTQKTLAKLSNIHKRKIRELLEINNLETKAEYDKTIKVLNKDQGNIVNTNLWKPLFRTINMVRHANALRVRFNYVIDIYFAWNHKETSPLITALVEWLVLM